MQQSASVVHPTVRQPVDESKSLMHEVQIDSPAAPQTAPSHTSGPQQGVGALQWISPSPRHVGLVVVVLVLVVVLVVVVDGITFVQSDSDVAAALTASKRPGSSCLIVAASNRTQLRSAPVVMRMATAPCGPASVRPTPRAVILMPSPCLSTTDLNAIGPGAAAELLYVCESTEASLLRQPGLPTPGGAVNDAPDGSASDPNSIVAPPGVPVPGSSADPIAGKRNPGSFETNVSFSLPDAERRSASFAPLIG